MTPKSDPIEPTSNAWLAAFQIALILASIALRLFVQRRVPAVILPFIAASFANCVLMIWPEWKRGLLSPTLGQLYQRARSGERFPKQTLGFAAVVASSIAMWHINMG